MVHADAATFQAGIAKEGAYQQVLEQARALFEGQRNWVCNLANTASLLWHAYQALPSPSCNVNWAGFYTLDPSTAPGELGLILGPFHGKVACQTIAFGRGVCGTAAAEGRTLVVPDVDAFPGHIACDGDSRSEIVVPIFGRSGNAAGSGQLQGQEPGEGGGSSRRVVAIIDVDCAVPNGFDQVDKVNLERLAELLGESCDW